MTTLPSSHLRHDVDGLQQHVSQCLLANGRLHRMRCAVESADALFAPRFASALALLVLVTALAALFWPG